MKTMPDRLQRVGATVRLCIALLTVSSLLVACTSVQQVKASELSRLTTLVEVNDTVTCTMRDGSIKTIKVTAVEPDTLIGENNQRVAVAEIAQADISRTDVTKSVLLGLAVAAGVAAAAMAGGGGGGGGMGGGGY